MDVVEEDGEQENRERRKGRSQFWDWMALAKSGMHLASYTHTQEVISEGRIDTILS